MSIFQAALTVVLSVIVALIFAVIFILSLFATPADAQQINCAPRDVILLWLDREYGETRRSNGLSVQGKMIEVFASSSSGTWSILETSPNGLTCLVDQGNNFEPAVVPQADDGAAL